MASKKIRKRPRGRWIRKFVRGQDPVPHLRFRSSEPRLNIVDGLCGWKHHFLDVPQFPSDDPKVCETCRKRLATYRKKRAEEKCKGKSTLLAPRPIVFIAEIGHVSLGGLTGLPIEWDLDTERRFGPPLCHRERGIS